MSFTDEVINEILLSDASKTCCRKAMLFGMLYGALMDEERKMCAVFRNEAVVHKAATILKKQFSTDAVVTPAFRAGRRIFLLEASTKAICTFLENVDGDGQAGISDLVGFRCDGCAQAFARGVFMSVATISDPKKSYHLEFSLPSARRADRLAEFFEEPIGRAGRVERNGKYGVYYKKSTYIEAFLYHIGTIKCGFEFSDDCEKHILKNIVNRSTNCETKNLSRVVDAAVKQIDAILALKADDVLQLLGEEVCYSAELRLNNPETPLSELAKLHQPPISRSMLNRRLTKILNKYEEHKTTES